MEGGRARGRARGRGRGEETGPVPPADQVRRPGAPESVAPQQPAWGGAGLARVAPQAHQVGTQPVQTGGRATAPRDIAPQPVAGSTGRATAHRGGVTQPDPSAAAPRAVAAEGNGAGVGRGASRGREQRDTIYTRPSKDFVKTGKDGMRQVVIANYFEVLRRPDMHLLQYRVDFTPDVDHMGVRKSLVRSHETTLGKYLFDGTLLYGIVRLPQPCDLMSVRQSDGSPVKITLKLVGEIQKEDATYVTVMNIILRRCLSMLNLTMIKRDYFDPDAAQDIPSHNLRIWPGYISTIRHHEDTFLLGVEIIHKVLRKDTALDVMGKLRSGGDFQGLVRAELEGKVIMTHYNNKTYRIDDIDFSMNPKSTFHLRKENKEISYMDYYRQRYNVTVRNETQPMLVSRPSRRDLNRGDDQPVYLIPELCGMTGLSDDMKKNFNLMKDVATITRVNPDRRVESLMKFRQRLAGNSDIQKELNSWGLKFSDKLVECNGRNLNNAKIIQNVTFEARDGDWSRNITSNKMCVSVQLKEWVCFYPSAMSAEVTSFVQMIQRVGAGQNFMVPSPVMMSMDQDRTGSYVEKIRGECGRQQYNMVMAVMKTQRADTYSSIKKVTCHELGVPSQVITGRILRGPANKTMSIATKVMIQIASKLGAEPWRVEVPKQTWMVIGYDTYHDARQRKAVGAFIASINPSFTRYVSSVMIHENNEEISPSFKTHLLKCLKAFKRMNGTLPSKIFVYRDGVGAGDISRIRDLEVGAIRDAFKEVERLLNIEYSPPLAFIIVSKRINTRFFLPLPNGARNPACGMVCDNTVTLHERFDFFLVSQKANQGTVSPTSFNIVEDTTATPPDIHQKLAYFLTHLYYNWPGTLRVPAPCQYAHKLAYLIGESMMVQPHENLSILPYYL